MSELTEVITLLDLDRQENGRDLLYQYDHFRYGTYNPNARLFLAAVTRLRTLLQAAPSKDTLSAAHWVCIANAAAEAAQLLAMEESDSVASSTAGSIGGLSSYMKRRFGGEQY